MTEDDPVYYYGANIVIGGEIPEGWHESLAALFQPPPTREELIAAAQEYANEGACVYWEGEALAHAPGCRCKDLTT